MKSVIAASVQDPLRLRIPSLSSGSSPLCACPKSQILPKFLFSRDCALSGITNFSQNLEANPPSKSPSLLKGLWAIQGLAARGGRVPPVPRPKHE